MQANVMENPLKILFCLMRWNVRATTRIDGPKYFLNNFHPGREVNGQFDLTHPDADTGCLEILVEPMCLSRTRNHQNRGDGDKPSNERIPTPPPAWDGFLRLLRLGPSRTGAS